MNTYVVLRGRNRVCVLSCVPVFSREFHVLCATAQLGCVTFLGVKNITNYHQSDEESPLFFPKKDDGTADAPDVVYIWGPLRGRFVYGGISAYF